MTVNALLTGKGHFMRVSKTLHQINVDGINSQIQIKHNMVTPNFGCT